jgi:hypothetical protein
MEVLERVVQWADAERFWIALFARNGWRLHNRHPGGVYDPSKPWVAQQKPVPLERRKRARKKRSKRRGSGKARSRRAKFRTEQASARAQWERLHPK